MNDKRLRRWAAAQFGRVHLNERRAPSWTELLARLGDVVERDRWAFAPAPELAALLRQFARKERDPAERRRLLRLARLERDAVRMFSDQEVTGPTRPREPSIPIEVWPV